MDSSEYWGRVINDTASRWGSELVMAFREHDADTETLSRNLAGIPIDPSKVTVKAYTRARLCALLEDVRGIAPGLLRDHENAVTLLSNKLDHEATFPSLEYYCFASNVKALFFFLRAEFDVHASILNELSGETSGGYTSLKKMLKKQPDRIKSVNDVLPDFYEWFLKFRKLRDDLKIGSRISCSAQVADHETILGIGFLKVDERENSISYSTNNMLFVSDIVEALRKTAQFTRYVCMEAQSRSGWTIECKMTKESVQNRWRT